MSSLLLRFTWKVCTGPTLQFGRLFIFNNLFGEIFHWLFTQPAFRMIEKSGEFSITHLNAQCVPVFSNPNQKVHGLIHFYIAGIHETDQNQLKKPSIIRVPKQQSSKNGFSLLKLRCWWNFSAMSVEVNFGSLMTDGFFN